MATQLYVNRRFHGEEIEMSEGTYKIDPDVWYTTAELATKLRCSKVKLDKMRTTGGLRFKKFGRQILYLGRDVLEDLEDMTKTSTAG